MRSHKSQMSQISLIERLKIPLFACNHQGQLVECNPAFIEAMGIQEADKDKLFTILGWQQDLEAWVCEGADGRSWRVEVHHDRDGYTGSLSKVPPEDEPRISRSWLEDAGVALEPIALFTRLFTKELTLPKRDEELLQSFIKICQQLLPERLFCIRLVEKKSGSLLHVLATGRLKESEREKTFISQGSLEYFGGPELLGRAIEISKEYNSIFQNSTSGFDVPLHDGNHLFGILSVEYTDDFSRREEDKRLIGYIALHFSTTLRFARMLGESIYSRDYFIKLLDNANAPILVADRHRRIKLINRAYEKLTGYHRDDVLDRDIKEFLAPKEREHFLPAVLNALRGRSTGNLEVRIPHHDGQKTAHISVSLAAVKSGYGEIEGVIAVGQDLTELRRLQQQIIHSEKLATIGQLAAGVVHELNNPLTSISVYSEYLLHKLEKESGNPSDIIKLTRICEGADRILKFTRDLVAYARPTGEEPRLVDLRKIVERSLVFCEHVIDSSKIRVSTKFADKVPEIYGVKGQLQQILVNLITNACDAMREKKHGLLHIEIQNREDRVLMSVSDTGPGIPEKDRERVFEPFFSTKPEGKGTGLGLSIVRNIITNHHGTVRAEEAVGGGTVFIVELFAAV